MTDLEMLWLFRLLALVPTYLAGVLTLVPTYLAGVLTGALIVRSAQRWRERGQ